MALIYALWKKRRFSERDEKRFGLNEKKVRQTPFSFRSVHDLSTYIERMPQYYICQHSISTHKQRRRRSSSYKAIKNTRFRASRQLPSS